jgi:hypothetical protein
VENTLCQRSLADGRPLVLVTLLCADHATRDRAIGLHGRTRYRPVFVVTDRDIAAIRAAGHVAEHFPDPSMVRRHSELGDWRTFLGQRWAILRAKWRPEFVVTAGLDFSDYLRACGVSGRVGA